MQHIRESPSASHAMRETAWNVPMTLWLSQDWFTDLQPLPTFWNDYNLFVRLFFHRYMNYYLVRILVKTQRTARLTISHCAPSRWWLIKNRYEHHLISTKLDQSVHLYRGLPCAPWSTMQVSGAQCRLMVHNIVLYHHSGAQHRFHKPDRQTYAFSGTYEPTIQKHRYTQ